MSGPLRVYLDLGTTSAEYQEHLQVIRDHCVHMSRRWSKIVLPPDFEQVFDIFRLTVSSTNTGAAIMMYHDHPIFDFEPRFIPEEGLALSFCAYTEGELVMEVNEFYKAGSGERINWPEAGADE
jgi:hypothetical protein